MAAIKYDCDKTQNIIHFLEKKYEKKPFQVFINEKKHFHWKREILPRVDISYFFLPNCFGEAENRALNYKPGMVSSVEHCTGSRQMKYISAAEA